MSDSRPSTISPLSAASHCPPETRMPAAFAIALLALAGVLAYWGSFTAPFIFDDLPGIVRNTSIRQLSSLGEVLLPTSATGTGVVGRPIVNLSLALNYAVGGLDVRGYHAFNLFVHVGAGALLFALVRRTLAQPGLAATFGATKTRGRDGLALVVALCWLLHPLQTESVVCVIQRTELLVGFFYLLTLYAFTRAAAGAREWGIVTVLACALGMATKEVMVTAPVIALLYDRTFLAGSFAGAWRQRRNLYLALAATWVPLVFLVWQGTGRGGTAGFGAGVSAWEYLLTQNRALATYLKLSFWPAPLVLDYGMAVARSLLEVWAQALLVVGLLIATGIALRRRPVAGFFGAWFFVILAPSSSFIPLVTQTVSEHRMYLPLAGVVAAAICGGHALLPRRGWVAGLLVVAVLGGLTWRRVGDYANALGIWGDTVRKQPANPRAHYNYGNALAAAHRGEDAIAHYKTALRLEPRYTAAHFNLAGTLLELGREGEAIEHYERVLRFEPNSADAHANLAGALVRVNRMAEAISHYEIAARHGMLVVEERRRFGRALAEVGRIEEGLQHLREAIRLDPKQAESHVVLGMVLGVAGRTVEALGHFTEAVVVDPQDAGARFVLADALLETGRPAEALSHYEAALKLRPEEAMLHTRAGDALLRLGRAAEAITRYEEALRLNPNDAEARANLERVRTAAQRRGLLGK